MACDIAGGGGDYLSAPIIYLYGEDSYVHDLVYSNEDKSVTRPLVIDAIIRNKVQAAQFEANNGGSEYCEYVTNELKKVGESVVAKQIGRKEILTSYANIQNGEELLKVLNNAISTHNVNEQAIKELENYYRGIHPILRRRKDIRADIKNNVIRPLPYAIVEFKKGYEFGNTIQYIQKRGNIAPNPEDIS